MLYITCHQFTNQALLFYLIKYSQLSKSDWVWLGASLIPVCQSVWKVTEWGWDYMCLAINLSDEWLDVTRGDFIPVSPIDWQVTNDVTCDCRHFKAEDSRGVNVALKIYFYSYSCPHIHYTHVYTPILLKLLLQLSSFDLVHCRHNWVVLYHYTLYQLTTAWSN